MEDYVGFVVGFAKKLAIQNGSMFIEYKENIGQLGPCQVVKIKVRYQEHQVDDRPVNELLRKELRTLHPCSCFMLVSSQVLVP